MPRSRAAPRLKLAGLGAVAHGVGGAATLLALMVGVMALVRFYSRPNTVFLFVGIGFLGTALLDGYHTVVTSTFFAEVFPSAPPALVPWSWLASSRYVFSRTLPSNGRNALPPPRLRLWARSHWCRRYRLNNVRRKVRNRPRSRITSQRSGAEPDRPKALLQSRGQGG